MTVDQYIALFASVGSCLAAIATLLTVHQMAKQRAASYRPELVISPVSLEAEHSNESANIFWKSRKPHYFDVSPRASASENEGTSIIGVSLCNIGLGAAKNIKINWQLPLNDVAEYIKKITKETDIKTKVTSINNKIMEIRTEDAIFNYHQSNEIYTFDYLLPISGTINGILLYLPDDYSRIIDTIIECYIPQEQNDLNYYGGFNIPPLAAALEWGDIAGQTYRSSVNISANVSWLGKALYLHLDVRRKSLYSKLRH